MRQYLEQKARVPDAILLFRMGDFYETFYDDAKTISRVLGLTLTAREKNSDSPVPLAGVPYHALDRYVARLVAAGYRVAISEQLEDAKLAKGVVKRDIVRIITPGTLTDEALLDARTDNLLVALCPAAGGMKRVGLACVELASGRFFAQMIDSADLSDELARLNPAELLIPESSMGETADSACELWQSIPDVPRCPTTSRPIHAFDPHLARERLHRQFGVTTLEGLGFDRFDESLCAAGALLDYLNETQKSALAHIRRLAPRSTERHMMIDQFTLRSLEIERTLRDGAREGSLLGALDATCNPMGARRLRQWLCYPLTGVAEIHRRQDAVAALVDQPDRLAALRNLIVEISDLERIAARLGVRRVSPRDLLNLGRSLERCAEAKRLIGDSIRESADDLLGHIAQRLGGHDDLARALTSALRDDAPMVARDGGFITEGYDAELDRLRQISIAGDQYLAEYQAREAQRTGIPNLKVGYNSVFGYYIEITHQHRDNVPPEYVRKQTVRNAERYITDELKKHEIEVLGAAERAQARELELFERLCARAAERLTSLQETADAVATLDVIASFAETARRRGYVRPEFTEIGDDLLEIQDGRHPVLDVTLAERFVPNDCRLRADGDRLILLTGPNMAGKSTYIRQIALLTLLAHTGSFVPAKVMRLTPVDRLFARVGASDELTRGQSTFMVEMVEAARILNTATRRSLVILDEIGRGTSTYDGLAIAWAITEHLARTTRCRTLFATHYHELTDLAGELPGVANFNVAVREELRPGGAGRGIVFLHRILPGPTDRSYGVHVAAMAGLPPSVVQRSEAILHELETRPMGTGPRPPRGKSAAAPNQLLLFEAVPSTPESWRLVAERLTQLNPEEMTPLAALTALAELRKTLAQDAPPSTNRS
ncbi:MAG: DNA mismatch repair protein MutS [Phycisphaerae bacterium]|nr:MAG: DNA mismatch repair protein MutS [Planctomycetia bacterium]GJQ27764.1 MAG: DNA mismatch repair protein MutS [Phycisphaerae bacterium]